ncbi:MAG: acetolactate synthase small subunit [Bacteroidales bacterium]|nr:acetolactate synthase small subunit [Bacteroidales bacterium]
MNKPEQQNFTLTVYSEHYVGLLNQVSIIFTRRNLNIEEVSASRTSIPGIHRLTITVMSDRETMEKVVQQIEKRIDVIRVFLYTDDEIIYQEIALYKVDVQPMEQQRNLENIIRKHSARVLSLAPDFIVLEKAGQVWETEALLNELLPYGVRQFVRSGRVCVTQSSFEELNAYLAEQDLRMQETLH